MDYESFARSIFTVVTVSGDEWDCLCPWHGDKSPSLRVNPKKGVFFCHGCHKKGTLKRLADERGTSLSEPDIMSILERAVEQLHAPDKHDRIYSESVLSQYKQSREYWTKIRGISDATAQMFDLGQDDVDRSAIIPMRKSTGELIGIIKRRLGNAKPKYLYPAGMRKSDHLFASWMLDDDHDTVVLVEGSVDAIAMWDAGIPALAILGSRISDRQIQLLNKLNVSKVIVFTDNDQAGEIGLCQIVDSLPKTILWSVAAYEDGWGKDPASLTIKQRKAAVRRAISQFDIV